MENTEVVIIFILVVLTLFYIQKKYLEVEYVVSPIDGKKYLVKNVENKEEAANMLARLNKKITTLLQHVEKQKPDNKDIKRLVSNYNVDNISEGT